MDRTAFLIATPLQCGGKGGARRLSCGRTLCMKQMPRRAASMRVSTNSEEGGPAVDSSAYHTVFSLLTLLPLLDADAANAAPESLVTAFKSIPASLAHPTVMWLLFGTAVYTFYLGYQSSLIRKSTPEERKVLVKERFPDRHFQTSSLLFATMTIATFTGMANTYTRTGKLFPGPHLYIGLGLVALMSVMSSLVPYMQKGKEWAKSAHFTLAFFALGMFGWQAKSGMVIVGKLLGWK